MARNHKLMKAVEQLLQEHLGAKTAFLGMTLRGASKEFAKDEIARAMLGCLWETNKGMPDRFADVLKQIGQRRTTTELFPDEIYK